MEQKFTQILLADDHTLLREALKYLITDLIKNPVIDEAWDTSSALKKIKQKEYQLIILDTKMCGLNSFPLVTDILNIKPNANILMFTINVSGTDAEKYLRLGAKGYIGKTAQSPEIKKIIEMILAC